jgi:hypothetical protein
VSTLSIRRRLCRQRRRLTVMATVVALAAAIMMHHSGLAIDAHDMGIGAVAEMCLGVFTAVGVAAAAVGLAILALGRWRPALITLPAGALPARPMPQTRSRHGPELLSLLCVSRR